MRAPRLVPDIADALGDDPQRDARVLARVRERQADEVLAYLHRLPWSYPGYLMLAAVAYQHGLRLSPAVWLVLVALLTAHRWRQARQAARLAPAGRAQALPGLLRGFWLSGLVIAGIVPFVFAQPGTDFAPQAVTGILMLVLAVGAGGVAGSALGFAGMAIPPTLALSAAWLLRGTPLDALIALGPWLVFLLLLSGVRDRARTMRALMRVVDANAQLSQVAREERDRAREASAAKTRFLASASHDLRQPLHAIGLFGAALEHELAGHAAQANARRLMGAVRTLTGSLDAMLDISQLDAGVVRPDRRPLALQPLLVQLLDVFEPQAHRRGLQLRIHSGTLWVDSDALLLQRLLGNLVDNALKYTRRGGVVVRARARGDQVWIDVRDTGIGIAPALQARVFEEFYQAGNPERDRAHGLGVGLSIVRRLSQLLDHPITLRSREGRGSGFRVVLPAAAPQDAASPPAPAPSPAPRTDLPRRVLVLDDDTDARGAMLELLAAFGIPAEGTHDEGHALAAWQQAHQAEQPFEAVLCDWRLAGGADGLAAAQRLRDAGGGGVPVLMVTGETDPAQLQRLHASGLPVLFKPVEARRLMAALAGAPQNEDR